jgi:hypothetical protein
MGEKRVPELETACDNYLLAKADFKEAGRNFSRARERVESLMEAEKLQRYEYDGRVFRLDKTEKLVVEKVKEEA